MHTELNTVLAENHILTEENKEKVIIITDIVRLAKLMGHVPPTTQEFNTMYDMPLIELELLQNINIQEQQLSIFTKMFYHK